MTFAATVLTLYPEMFPGPLGVSLAGRALEEGRWSLDTVQIRDFAIDKHRTVDDTPSGGGAGMVLRADVLSAAVDFALAKYLPGTGRGTAAEGGGGVVQAGGPDLSSSGSPPVPLHHPADGPPPRAGEVPVIAMTPRGRPLTQARVRELAAGPGVIILCGRFEGFDERIFEARPIEQVSIGDIVLSGGEPAAIMLLDACIRLLPGVMGAPSSGSEESFENGLLEYPHYTRPATWEGRTIPEVLRSGDHAKIAAWRKQRSEIDTRSRRPDLWERHEGARVQSASGARREEKDKGS
jgi:tRNA (guanine37-N1)-methyltransferase